jgi:DNA repair protein RadD
MMQTDLVAVPSAPLVLRDYQREAVDAVFAAWTDERVPQHPLVEVPTGGGKSAIIGEIVRRLVEDHGARVVVATHRKELIEQDAAAIRRVWPAAPIGIWSAGLGKREWDAPIVVGGVQTMARAARRLGHRDVVLIDEAHLVPADSETLYGRLLSSLERENADVRRVGLTATPYRLDQGLLTESSWRVVDGKTEQIPPLFTSIAYRVEVRRLVDAGHLAPLVTGAAGRQIDLSRVGTRLGEFAAQDLELAANVDEINGTVADDVCRLLDSGRKSAILFGVSVAHAQALRLEILRRFRSCEVVTGDTDPAQRRAILAAFKAGEISVLSSCDVLTTGFDAPGISVVGLVRPTKSTSLYVQMVGRGMRPAEGKRDCVVLDYGANIARHGPVDDVKIKPKGPPGEGKAPVRTCPQCGGESPTASRVCLHCDYEYPPPERKASHTASGLPILSWTAEGVPNRTRHVVDRVEAHKHVKRGSTNPPTVRVEYWSGGDGELDVGTCQAKEWICVEHEGFARAKAEAWWRANVGTRFPSTVDDAIALIRDGAMGKVISIETEVDPKNAEYRRVVRIVRQVRTQAGADDGDGYEIDSDRDQPAATGGVDDMEELPF